MNEPKYKATYHLRNSITGDTIEEFVLNIHKKQLTERFVTITFGNDQCHVDREEIKKEFLKYEDLKNWRFDL